MFSWATLAVFCGAFFYVIAGPVQCKIGDLDCLKTVFADDYLKVIDGGPEMHAENLDPMHHDEINGNWSNLTYKMINSTITGFKNCKIEDLKILSRQTHTMQITLICPKLTMNGKYEIHGQLMVLPVEGNGDFAIYSNKYKITMDCDVKVNTGKDGKHYFSIKSYKYAAEPLESVKYEFKNLFNGQKDLADVVDKYANENWYEVAKEFQDPIYKANVKKLIKNVNKYFKKKPLEDFLSMLTLKK